ncbi:PH domain-containing protein [Winogradskya consettensis]|uniref:PH domain-containing protein n=1 Tax=Winogradskya consettensis TaxID=113560 RepID=UPI001BB44E5E|nr:PH domain-containing protein [Actinoplanes consettensis]
MAGPPTRPGPPSGPPTHPGLPGGPPTHAGPPDGLPAYPGLPDGPDAGGHGAEGGGTRGEPRRRLHPLSPLLNGAKSIAVIVAALSWQTLSQVGLERFAIVVAVLAVGVVIYSVIGWLNTGYHLVGRELRIQDGLLWRRNRAIPLDRLQAVELRRPLLAQLTGLAELRLEVVGGGKTEAPLAYLSVKEASALRERLLALAGRTPGSGEQATAEQAPMPERPLFRVRNRDLVISQLLTPQAFFLPVGVAFVVTQFVLEGSWTFIGIASTVTAMAGVVLQPVRRVLQDWDFRLGRDADGRLSVRFGLVETRSQIVPLNRVQAIGVTWPLLWRLQGWLHLRLDIAGYAGPQSGGDDKRSDRLLPVGVFEAGRLLVWEVLPGVDLGALPTAPPPRRARWLHPFAFRAMGAGLTPEVFVARTGVLTREMTLVPYARLQSVRVIQGPVQRLLDLATVYADTAGGQSGVAKDRDVAEAWWLAEQLSIRARQARGPAPLMTSTVNEPVDALWQRPDRAQAPTA